MKLEFFAGNHTRRNCPVSCEVLPEKIRELTRDGHGLLLKAANGVTLACDYREENGTAKLAFVADYIGKGENVKLELAADESEAAPRMRCVRTEHGVSVYDGGLFLTEYYTGADIPKPYLGPLRELYGADITRLDFDTHEHPHHRAVWVSHGDVNGVDTWNEPAGKHGFIKNRAIKDVFEGNAGAGFTAENLWTNFSGDPLCEEVTRYTFHACAAGLTLIDIVITLKACFGEVRLGSTKEAGPIAVRMAESIKVVESGTMVSGTGGINEKEIWMKRAPWVDYYGVADRRVCGVAIFDSPENDSYPAWWHARDYGLMAPNNFHVGGERVIAHRGSMTWSYRLAAHNGDSTQANIAGLFADFVSPPTVKTE